MNVKILAIGLVAIVCVAAVGIYFITDDGNDGPIKVIDGSGAEIVLDEPLTEVITVNSNAPRAMKILGLDESVKGMSFSGSSDTALWNDFSPLFPSGVAHMSPYASMSAEEVAQVCKYVLCPVASMTVSAENEKAYANLGITVIRLDFNGETTLEDLDKLAELFGRTEKVTNALNAYLDMYNSVVDKVVAESKKQDNSDKTFIYYMNSRGGGAFYNQTSAGNKMIESIYGTNALRNIDGLDTSGISNLASETNIHEVIIQEDARNAIDKIFFRGSADTADVSSAKTIWDAGLIAQNYGGLTALSDSTDVVYVFNSDVMSGPLAYVAYVLIAEACGFDTGYSVASLIGEYNQMYGFSEKTSGLMFKMNISGGVSSAEEVIVV